MKQPLLITLLFFLLAGNVQAQAPQAFNYQGVARNTVGTPLPAQAISLRLSILADNASGTTVYAETHSITRKDGGILIGTEAYYTTSRFNNWNRWDYLYGSPYMSSFNNSYYYSPYYSNYFWRSRSNNQAVRYHADNIAVLSFDNKGKLEWTNVMGKSQYDDESDDLLSYQLMNTGGQIHFLFNQQERRNNLLSDYSITPDGVMTRSPTLKNLDKGYEFMPQYGKQVSSRQMIVPCLYRNYICFAKIDYTQN